MEEVKERIKKREERIKKREEQIKEKKKLILSLTRDLAILKVINSDIVTEEPLQKVE